MDTDMLHVRYHLQSSGDVCVGHGFTEVWGREFIERKKKSERDLVLKVFTICLDQVWQDTLPRTQLSWQEKIMIQSPRIERTEGVGSGLMSLHLRDALATPRSWPTLGQPLQYQPVPRCQSIHI